MLYALLLVPVLLGFASVVVARARRPVRILEEAAPGADNPFEELDALLSTLERTSLDVRDADELDVLADELERAVRLLEGVG